MRVATDSRVATAAVLAMAVAVRALHNLKAAARVAAEVYAVIVEQLAVMLASN